MGKLHLKVMLLGHSDTEDKDKVMRVTVSHNWFGPSLTQRMPRGRFGTFHVFNNLYTKWEMYAIGGSADPVIMSEGNRFIAPDRGPKQVTKILEGEAVLMSYGDEFVNGATFQNTSDNNGRPFNPSYPYKVLVPTNAMASMIESSAGWQNVPLPDTRR